MENNESKGVGRKEKHDEDICETRTEFLLLCPPLVKFAVDDILCLISRRSCGEIQEVGQELLGHVVKQLVGYTQGFTRACWTHTHHLDRESNFVSHKTC